MKIKFLICKNLFLTDIIIYYKTIIFFYKQNIQLFDKFFKIINTYIIVKKSGLTIEYNKKYIKKILNKF